MVKLALVNLLIVFGALGAQVSAIKKMKIQESVFGTTADGQTVKAYTGTNRHGLAFKLITYGARMVSLEVPDRSGKLDDVVLGLKTVGEYEKHTAHIGGTVGRYANRIAGASFVLNGKTYQLAKNVGANSLHGGIRGFDNVVWASVPIKTSESVGVEFTYVSKDGEEGYPGTLTVKVTYTLNNKNELKFDYAATSDAPTVLNLTNHAYWNLGGAKSRDIMGDELWLAADHFVAVDANSIPTGALSEVKNTAMDFNQAHAIGLRAQEVQSDPKGPKGYDHCYVVRGVPGNLRLAARVKDGKSGRTMDVSTTEPAMQLYTSNFLDGSATNGGFKQYAAVCLEAQHYPDSPHQPNFPTTVLNPGETYHQTTLHRFWIE